MRQGLVGHITLPTAVNGLFLVEVVNQEGAIYGNVISRSTRHLPHWVKSVRNHIIDKDCYVAGWWRTRSTGAWTRTCPADGMAWSASSSERWVMAVISSCTTHTWWPISSRTRFCWQQFQSYVTRWTSNSKTQLQIWSQHILVREEMGHPVVWFMWDSMNPFYGHTPLQSLIIMHYNDIAIFVHRRRTWRSRRWPSTLSATRWPTSPNPSCPSASPSWSRSRQSRDPFNRNLFWLLFRKENLPTILEQSFVQHQIEIFNLATQQRLMIN